MKMKIQVCSTILFLYLSICNVNKGSALEVIREYHYDSSLIHSDEGCHHKINNSTVHTHFAPVQKLSRRKKRQLLNRVPLEKPLTPIFECNVGTQANCDRLKRAVEYANTLVGSALDIYNPIIVKYVIRDDLNKNYNAQTSFPVTYSLKDPNENMVLSYPVALVKQLNTNKEIIFNQKDDFDILTKFNVKSLKEENQIESTVIHELLHGLGVTARIRRIENGNLGDDIPNFGSNYYIPDFIRLDLEGEKSIDGFLPVGIYERHFVEYSNPDHYYFTQLFNSITDYKNLNIIYHQPAYYDDKRQLQKIEEYVETWQGMEEGETFERFSHEFKEIAFRTKEGSLLPICSYSVEDGKKFNTDLHHIMSKKFTSDEPYTDDNIDENFVIYRFNINLLLSAEEKVAKYGPNNPNGLFSEELLQMLSTMGYHRKNAPEDNRVYEVISENVMIENKGSVDGDDSSNGNIEDDMNDNVSKAYSNASLSLLLSTFAILFTISLL